MKKFYAAIALCASLVAFAWPAVAQTPNITGNTFQTGQAGKTVQGVVGMCVNASNVAIPCPYSSTGPNVTANQGIPGSISAGWPVSDSAGVDTSGSFTGAGSATLNASIDGYASAKVLISGTYAGFTVNVLASSNGGTTFPPFQCALADGSQIGTSFVLAANQTAEIACGHLSGDDTLQIQTSAGPATGTASIDISPSAFPSMDGVTVAALQPAGSRGTLSGAVTNPASILTMTSATTAYSAGQLIASSATAGSVVNPSFVILNSGGGAAIPRLRISNSDTTTTAWPGVQIQIDLWTATPTWTNGDRATWLPATGAGFHLASYTCTMSTPVWGDGYSAECGPAVGTFSAAKLASGTQVFWSLKAVSASGITGASKIWSLIAELVN